MEELANLPNYPGGQTPHIRLNNRRCDSCGQTETVQITRYWYEKGDKGLDEKSEKLTQHLLLDAHALNALQNALVAQAAAKEAVLNAPEPPGIPPVQK